MQSLRPILLLLALLAIPHLLPASTLTSYSFVPYPQGAYPQSPLLLASDGNYYGTTLSGGFFGYGTVFKLTPGGTLTTLVNFNNKTNGANPPGGVIQASDGNFYGTTQYGGSSGFGTVFKLTPSGTLTTFANFNSTTGSNPRAGLIQASDGNFYGTTSYGSDTGHGTAFRLTPDGTLTTLANFSGNSYAPLIQGSDGNFYGTTFYAGTPGTSLGYGTVFQLTPGGTFTTIASFNNTDGAGPSAGLIQDSHGNFYGTTTYGGPGSYGSGSGSGNGTVFELSPNGNGFTLSTLLNFNSTNGANPYGGLIQDSQGNIYGTTAYGGSSGDGTVFQLTPNGAGFTLNTLVNFSGTNGGSPSAGLIQDSLGNFYGTTAQGTIFKLMPGGTLTNLFTFNCSCGTSPTGGLTQAKDGNFYGTTQFGSPLSYGTVFKFTPGGSPTTLVNFNGTNGRNPYAGLIQGNDGNLYGTTYGGAASSEGTVFQVTTGGTLTTMVKFTGPNGAYPQAGVIQGSDGNFYGTTTGGSGYFGTVFQLTPGGTLTTLFNFNFDDYGSPNGDFPIGGLIQGSDGNFYGTTQYGGSAGNGTVFKVTSGGALTTLVNFNIENANGACPYAGLIQGRDGNFYGTDEQGGSSGSGTVFQLTPGGTLTTFFTFNASLTGTNPYAPLIQGSDGNFYGTTYHGGSSNLGTVFQLTPGGTLTTLVNFNSTNGANPYAGLYQGTDGNFYSTTQNGGTANAGTVFRLDLTSSETVSFTSASTIPIVSSAYTITGSALSLALNYAPSPGDVLTVIQNTGGSPISGTFTNLPNGGTITASYGDTNYTFTANYSGNTDGQDLTLTLTSAGNNSTPLLPTWAWLLLLTGLFLASARRLRPA